MEAHRLMSRQLQQYRGYRRESSGCPGRTPVFRDKDIAPREDLKNDEELPRGNSEESIFQEGMVWTKVPRHERA